jgi:predicted nucleotidyltransferase
MTPKTQTELKNIVSQITTLIPDAKVILFGSYAKGTQHDESDLDLCVIANTFTGRRINMMHAIRYAIYKKTSLPLDILVYTKDEFEKNSQVRSRLEYNIATEGMVLNA